MRDPHQPMNPWPTFNPSPARRGLDALLNAFPFFDLLSVDWQLPDQAHVAGSWLLVELGQPSQGDVEAWAVWKFAIWKRTGAVHRIEPDGSVSDDPIIEPAGPIGDELRVSVPGYWMNEQSGVLAPIVRRYLDGAELQPLEVGAMRAYLRQWINADFMGPGIPELRADVEKISSTTDVRGWLARALEQGIDPL